MVDAGQGAEAGASQNKSWALLLAVAATLITSVTSVGLQAWNTIQTQTRQDAMERKSERDAYNLYISEARLTESRRSDVEACQFVLEVIKPPLKPEPKPVGSGVPVPRYFGTPFCDGLTAHTVSSADQIEAAHDRVYAVWMDGRKKLDEARRELVKYADQATIDLINNLYSALGSLGYYSATLVEENFEKLEAELCKQFPEEC